MLIINVEEGLEQWIGKDLGTSSWLKVEQPRIDAFAEATGDRQWIHVNPERAAHGPYGHTIAHGYLSLSLLPTLAAEIYAIEGCRMTLNYGLNKVRFPAPVVVGSRVRNILRLAAADVVSKGILLTLHHTLEIEGSGRPAVAAEQLRLLVV